MDRLRLWHSHSGELLSSCEAGSGFPYYCRRAIFPAPFSARVQAYHPQSVCGGLRGVGPQDIISNLEKFSKSPLTTGIREWIWECTSRYGTLRLVLKRNSYFIESSDAAVLQRLLQDEVIGLAASKAQTRSSKKKRQTWPVL